MRRVVHFHRRPDLHRAYDRIKALLMLGDSYLQQELNLALAERQRAVLVSGDQHLLTLADELPIQTARVFLDSLADA